MAIVDEELPYPANSGKRIRTLNLLLRLAERHQISLICHANCDPAETQAAQRYLTRQGIECVVVERQRPRGSALRKDPAFYAGLLWNLRSSRPYLVDVNYSTALRRAVTLFAAKRDVDVWQCEWTPYLRSMRGIDPGRIVAMAHNVESVIWQRYYQTELQPAKRWYIKEQWRKMLRFEASALGQVQHAVAVSESDARLLREEFGCLNVTVVDNGVDLDFFQPSAQPREAAELLFLGSLDWRPNLDAARLLLEKIFPAVHARLPEAKLRLAGRNPPEWLARLARATPGVELAANVPDVRPLLASCAAMLVPLRIGGGSRLKILEALAMQTPVISTDVGAEGLEVEHGVHLCIEPDIDRFAESVVQRLADEAWRSTVGEQGRQLVERQYGWPMLADNLERVWLACAQRAARRRRSA